MSGALTTDDRRRLIGILSRLASDHLGERAAAGLLASRLLRDRGISWEALVDGQATQAQAQTHAPRRPWPGQPPPPPRDTQPSDPLELALRHVPRLTPWECDFVLSLRGRWTRTPRQNQVLDGIAASLRRRGFT